MNPEKNQTAALDAVRKLYPEQINPYCRKLIADHPQLAPMYVADPRELENHGLSADGLGEMPLSPFPHLIRTYRDRALLLTTGRCFARCRFCFRKRIWRSDCEAMKDPSGEELAQISDWLKQRPEIDEILFSGGDAMTLPDERLFHLIELILNTGTIRTIRICSRAPAVQPDRITDTLAERLGLIDGIWFVCHFNHPAELTTEAEDACRKLVRHGVPMLNQTVLLAGVNDDPEILRRLFKRLSQLRVKPHYLFHIDPVEGVGHFATGVQKGLDIMNGFRDTLSSIARPDYSLDLPAGGGKVILTPDVLSPDGQLYWSAVQKRYLPHPLAGAPDFRKAEE